MQRHVNPALAEIYKAAQVGSQPVSNETPSRAVLFVWAFKYWQRMLASAPMRHKAQRSIERARADAQAGRVRYLSSANDSAYGPKFAAYGEKHMRWIENPAKCGLRFVEYADNLEGGPSHQGWYIDEHCGETVRGIVYQLPGRGGLETLVYGYADPYNDGPACLCFSFDDDRDNAARWADTIAGYYAEAEREYQELSSAGLRYAEAVDEIRETRRATLALIREAKPVLRGPHATTTIGQALRAQIESNLGSIEQARETRDNLLADYGHNADFREHAGIAA